MNAQMIERPNGFGNTAWHGVLAQEQMLQQQASSARADADHWKREFEGLLTALHTKDGRIERLAAELRDANRKLNELAAKVAAWDHSTGDGCERIAVCEASEKLDGTGDLIWMPVLSSDHGMQLVAEELLRQRMESLGEGEHECHHCSGTGEGQHDGQACSACNGRGC